MNFKEMEKMIKQDGWVKRDIVGSHHHYEHSVKKGKVTIPFHGNKELSKFVVNSILKQAGLKE
ncbi:type II toxin-antitoxin system HicA family toxin [Treponema medium]|nr:type II toxin-antitoxin system HicA family toxin [Treponema medium]QSH93338.1 type II toxin-antitoxin system HicA family toxin [Treponema medium]